MELLHVAVWSLPALVGCARNSAPLPGSPSSNFVGVLQIRRREGFVGDLAQGPQVLFPRGATRRGQREPGARALADEPLADPHQAGGLQLGGLPAEDRVADLQVVADDGEFRFLGPGEGGDQRKAHGMGQLVRELQPRVPAVVVRAGRPLRHFRASSQAPATEFTVIAAAMRMANQSWPERTVLASRMPTTHRAAQIIMNVIHRRPNPRLVERPKTIMKTMKMASQMSIEAIGNATSPSSNRATNQRESMLSDVMAPSPSSMAMCGQPAAAREADSRRPASLSSSRAASAEGRLSCASMVRPSAPPGCPGRLTSSLPRMSSSRRPRAARRGCWPSP